MVIAADPIFVDERNVETQGLETRQNEINFAFHAHKKLHICWAFRHVQQNS